MIFKNILRLQVALIRNLVARFRSMQAHLDNWSLMFVKGQCEACVPIEGRKGGWPIYESSLRCILPKKHVGPHATTRPTGSTIVWHLEDAHPSEERRYKIVETKPGAEEETRYIYMSGASYTVSKNNP